MSERVPSGDEMVRSSANPESGSSRQNARRSRRMANIFYKYNEKMAIGAGVVFFFTTIFVQRIVLFVQ